MSCSLCGLKGTLHEDDVFVVDFCATHTDTPMAVLKRHVVEPTREELSHIYEVMAARHPDRKPRGTGMASIKGHWHEHWIPK